MEFAVEDGDSRVSHSNETGLTSQINYSNGDQAAYGFTVDEDVRALYQQFIDKGIQVGRLSEYAGLSFKIYDPDGNAIELWEDYPTT
ncbi:hypothetical protein PCCS19_17890 [Paenibacillus sp. CCS19]|uniref:VOC family protein n=1 Tax=Paenibacillus sp. CCS19 TaxID=3158387 RepID=UPI002562FE7F|nr:hypothetical protein [Paenibacillus cellulosilyticus]GMK38735.1 hypothetical protein PCCS19_17890 [Paenibacillus cellulosilyticus]